MIRSSDSQPSVDNTRSSEAEPGKSFRRDREMCSPRVDRLHGNTPWVAGEE